jgi:hypothetical protein
LSDWIVDKMTSDEAKWAFLRVGRMLLDDDDDDAGPSDFFRYGEPWGPCNVSDGRMMAAAHALYPREPARGPPIARKRQGGRLLYVKYVVCAKAGAVQDPGPDAKGKTRR